MKDKEMVLYPCRWCMNTKDSDKRSIIVGNDDDMYYLNSCGTTLCYRWRGYISNEICYGGYMQENMWEV